MDFLEEIKYLIGIVLAIVLGFAIGIERKTRAKEAGIRTHAIVCFGAALITVISKYGFLGDGTDPSRIASSIITGIGFLGAGLIVYRKRTIYGLTTAAGIWTTAGVGMACGAGLYLVAVGATILLITIQCVLHIKCRLFNVKKTYDINITFVETENCCDRVKELFNVAHFNKVVVNSGEVLEYSVSISTDHEITSNYISKILKENNFIKSITRSDEVF